MKTTTEVLIIIGIFAFIVIIAFVMYRLRIWAKITGPFGTGLEIKGENTTGVSKKGIFARNITSRKSSVQAIDKEGSGITAVNIEAKKKIILSSGTESSKQKDLNSSVSIDAKTLISGGDITIQQFVGSKVNIAEQFAFFARDIGLSNSKQYYERYQFEEYCNTWRSLQSLRLSADDLWESANSDNILNFAENLRNTIKIVREGEIFFEDSDRVKLLDVLDVFASFSAGKARLIQLRTEHDILKYGLEMVVDEISDQIGINSKTKKRYEDLLENIRRSFQKKLSN